MRHALALHRNERATYTGIFSRFGTCPAGGGLQKKTVLLTHVTDQEGEVVTEHIWLTLTAALNGLDLRKGNVITFNARVEVYLKGYSGNYQLDYRLTRPEQVRKVTKEAAA